MKNNLSNIKKSKYYLNKNECVGIPTETVYGIGVNPFSQEAVDKIFELKGRDGDKPLSILVIIPLLFRLFKYLFIYLLIK